MDFAKQVRKIKHDKGITNEMLSAETGIPLGTLAKILSGITCEPKLSSAVKIAEALGTTLGELLGEKEVVLSDEETAFIESYRMLDMRAKNVIGIMVDKEIEHLRDEEDKKKITHISEEECGEYVTLPLFLLPVSAGTGAILDNSDSENIQVRSSYTTRNADFALKVSGNSMEPTFRNGDVLLVKTQNSVEKGELGIFIGDGEGYFKRFMGKYLHSLNPSYDDIPLSRFTDFLCCGKVIGNLKQREA